MKKKNKSKKIICVLIAAMVSTVAFAGCVEENAASVPVVEESLVVTTESNVGIALMSESVPLEEYDTYDIPESIFGAEFLTATVKPSIKDKRVDFSLSWANAYSDWAMGKNVSDYVTIAQETDGAPTVLLTCHQAFGEQIKVTVTARATPETKVTCMLDFKEKLTTVYFKLFKEGTLSTMNESLIYEEGFWKWVYEPGTGHDADVKGSGRTGDHTIKDTFFAFITFSRTSEYTALLREQEGVNPALPEFLASYETTLSGLTATSTNGVILGGEYLPAIGIVENTSAVQPVVMEGVMNACKNALKALGDKPFMVVTVTGISDSERTMLTQEIPIYADLMSF